MEIQKSKAEIYYEKQLARIRKYNNDHRAELNARAKEYFKKIKEDPDKYKVYKENKKKKYAEQNPKTVLPIKEFI